MKLILILTAFLSVIANAQNPNESAMPLEPSSTASTASVSNGRSSFSEALFFADHGSHHFDFNPEILNQKYSGHDANGNIFSREAQTQICLISYEHGFVIPDVAFRAETSFGSRQSTSTHNGWTNSYNYSGNGDVYLSLKGKDADVNGNFISEITLGLSTEKNKFAYINAGGNMSSGGSSLTPRLAYEVPTSFGAAGAQLSYTLYGRAESEGNEITETSEGGNTLKLKGFAEMERSRTWMAGASLAVFAAEGEKVETKELGVVDNYDYEAYNTVLAEVYGKAALSKTMSVKPALSYSTVTTSQRDGNTYDKNEMTSVSITLGASF